MNAWFYSFNEGSAQSNKYLYLHHPAYQNIYAYTTGDAHPEGWYCTLDGTPVTGPEIRRSISLFGPIVRDSAWAL